MNKKDVPNNCAELIAFADGLANILASRKLHEVAMFTDTEALLRMYLDAASFANTVYAAVLEGSGKSGLAARFLAEAYHKRDRAQRNLRILVVDIIKDLFETPLDPLELEEETADEQLTPA